MGSPWRPPETQVPQPNWPSNGASQPPYGPPPPVGRASHETRRWGFIAAVMAANIVAVAAASAITYAITKNGTSSTATPSPSSTAPTYTAAEQASAKNKVCQAFDTNTAGTQGQGPLVNGGQLNVPAVVRALNGAVAVQDARSPAVSPEFASTAGEYVSKTLDMTSAALAGDPVDEINRLKDSANTAVAALADACGLPH